MREEETAPGSLWQGDRLIVGDLTYKGEWKNDKYSGRGEEYCSDPTYPDYRGDFRQGKRHGKGTLFSSYGTPWKEGLWENGELVSVTFEYELPDSDYGDEEEDSLFDEHGNIVIRESAEQTGKSSGFFAAKVLEITERRAAQSPSER